MIYVEDQDGNLLTSDNTTMVTVSLASGTGTLQGTKSVTVVNGVATFAGLFDNTAETISLKFSGDGLTAGPSSNITVSPAAPYQLLIHTQPSSAATAGQPFPTQPVDLRSRPVRQSRDRRQQHADHGVTGQRQRPAPRHDHR